MQPCAPGPRLLPKSESSSVRQSATRRPGPPAPLGFCASGPSCRIHMAYLAREGIQPSETSWVSEQRSAGPFCRASAGSAKWMPSGECQTQAPLSRPPWLIVACENRCRRHSDGRGRGISAELTFG